jgi:hypothetical protein
MGGDDIHEKIEEVCSYYKEKSGPAGDHQLVYDSPSETLEPLYFWFLDFMSDMFSGKIEKITDNFASSPGSGHFSDLRGKASQMQQEASRVLGTVNNILKGVINLLYDLKEFKIRLSHYDAAKSGSSEDKQAGLLALKQLWMDKVDVQRGQGSINMMTAGDLNFVTLRDAFLAAKSVEDVKDLDLNERVKRILKPRIQEFFEWKKRSEQELRKRFEIEKTYLKSQVEALKLNARWAKPYLRDAERLMESDKLQANPALVTAFNTVLLEVCLMGKRPIKVESEVIAGKLPESFKNMKNLRTYYSVVVVDFVFRGIPGRSGQHWTFGGRGEANFKAYALNEDELTLFKDKLSQSDFDTALKFVQGMTDESLSELKVDIDEFLGAEDEKPKKVEINPFTALFTGFKSKEEKEKKEDKEKKEKLDQLREKGVKPDSFQERYVRSVAEATAVNNLYVIYDIYKKAHGMASWPYKDDERAKAPGTKIEKFLGFK